MEPMETDKGDNENHPKCSEETVPPHKGKPVLGTVSVSNHSPKSTALPEKEKDIVDLPEITTQMGEQVSSGNHSKDFTQNHLSGISEVMKTSSTDGDEMHLEIDMHAKKEPATELSASSLPSKQDTAEDISSTCESHQLSCLVDPCSISDTENSSAEMNKAQLEKITNKDGDKSPTYVVSNSLAEVNKDQSKRIVQMDGDKSPGYVSDALTPDGGQSPRRNDANKEVVLHVPPISSATFSTFEKDTVVTNDAKSSLEVKECHVVVLLKPQEDTGSFDKDSAMPVVPLYLSNISSTSNEDADTRQDNNSPITLLTDVDGHEAERTGVDAAAGCTAASPQTPSLSKVEGADVAPTGQDCSQATLETPTKKDVDTEKLYNETMGERGTPASDRKETVNYKSFEDNPHLECKQMSPTCLLPTLKLQDCKTPSPVKCNVENLSTETETQQSPVEKEVVTENRIHSRNTSSVKQDAAAAKEQNRGLESGSNVLEKQSQHAATSKETSPAAGSAECLVRVRCEMGPPLPPLLTPLSMSSKTGKSINPKQAIGKLSFSSPKDRLVSPTTPVKAHLTPNRQQLTSSSLNSPLSPSRVPSSPLQFGSATPKHAVPVPGRLPLTAMNLSPSPSSSASQENSMRILDTMYPELSARARTLSILRGNVNLSICSSESGALPPTTDSQLSGFKTINSPATAFTETETRREKRRAVNLTEPENSKCPRLDSSQVASTSNSGEEIVSPQIVRLEQFQNETSQSVETGEQAQQNIITNCLKKIENRCFDLTPVIQSHLHVGNLPKKPVLRDEEKEVISEVCQSGLVSMLGLHITATCLFVVLVFISGVDLLTFVLGLLYLYVDILFMVCF